VSARAGGAAGGVQHLGLLTEQSAAVV
jgi:hypothetical protein